MCSNVFQTVSHTSTSTNQNFITGCWYFLKKGKLLVQTKTLLFIAGIFLIFLFLCDAVAMSLSYLSSDDGLIFFCFSFCGALGLLCLKFKKHKGSDSISSLMGNYHKSYLHAYLSEFLGEWLEIWTRGFIKDDVINGRFIYINSLYNQSVIQLIAYRHD